MIFARGDKLIKRLPIIVFLAIGFFGAQPGAGKPVSPIVKSEFIFIQDIPNAPFSHAATIAQTSSGFVAAWYGGTKEGNCDTKIFCSRFERNSPDWTISVIVAEGNDGKKHDLDAFRHDDDAKGRC